MARIRWIRADVVTSCTQRTSERRFLFKPCPEVRKIIGASAARAQEKFPVKLYWLEANTNHFHYGIAPTDDSSEAATRFVRFRQLFNRLVAEEINRLFGKTGAVFGRPANDIHCLDDESVLSCFYYALTNPVKDGLCDSVAEWEGFSSYVFQTTDALAEFEYIDRTTWHLEGRRRPLQAYAKTALLLFTPLPGMEKLSDKSRRAHIAAEVAVREARFFAERRKSGRKAKNAAGRAKIKPMGMPKNRASWTPCPLCHAATIAAYEAYRVAYRAFLKAYRAASREYLSGKLLKAFPPSSLRPPIIRVFSTATAA